MNSCSFFVYFLLSVHESQGYEVESLSFLTLYNFYNVLYDFIDYATKGRLHSHEQL